MSAEENKETQKNHQKNSGARKKKNLPKKTASKKAEPAKQPASLEEALREYQEQKRREFRLHISGLDDVPDVPEDYVQNSGYEPAVASRQLLPDGLKRKLQVRAKQNRRLFFWMWLAMIVVLSYSLARFAMVNINDMLAVNREADTVQIQIPRNATGDQVGQILKDSGVIDKPHFFALYSKMTKSEGYYQYGTYEIKRDMDYEALINHVQLNANRLDNETTRVVFTEGMSVLQIAQKLEEHNICTVDEVLAAANNAKYFDRYNAIKAITNDKERYYLLEGYLFPDSYDFYTGENAVDALSKLLNNYKDKITQEMKDKAAAMNLSMDQVITLASMIQAEAANTDDMYTISSIFHNRLQNGAQRDIVSLDSDPTVWYPYHSREDAVAAQGDGFKSRYNTYSVQGLPPGPICNPGMDAIDAALNPKTTDYYYFCHKDGKAYYAKTFEEHQRNLQQLGLA